LDAAKKEHDTVREKSSILSQQAVLGNQVVKARSRAEASERQYATLCGLGKTKLQGWTETELSFCVPGPCPGACLSITFNLTNPSEVICVACIKPSLFSRYKGRPLRSVSSYFEARYRVLCEELSREKLASPRGIGAVLRKVEWIVGRTEQTARELAMLQRRYTTKLSSSDGQTSSLEVEFSYQKSTKVVVSFDVSEAYPFSPVNVGMHVYNGEVDLDGLRALLIKNAKPGFGYLSRTCDVIAAFLH
jgi:hypothetical protein